MAKKKKNIISKIKKYGAGIGMSDKARSTALKKLKKSKK